MAAYLLAVLAGVFWGVGELFTKAVLHTGKIGPITAAAVRTTVALPLLWGAYLLAQRAFRGEPAGWTGAGTPTLLKLALGSGVLAGGLAMICFYSALSMGEVSRVKPIAFCIAPATAAALASIFLGEPMTAKKAAGLACVLAGVVLLTWK